MELLIENILIYSLVAILCIGTVLIYVLKKRKESRIVDEKIRHAKEYGLHEPVSLHPYVDVNSCIQTGACISACPEKDIIGIKKRKSYHYQCIPVHRAWGMLPRLSYPGH